MASRYDELRGQQAVAIDSLMRAIALVAVLPTPDLRKLQEYIALPIQSESVEERAVCSAYAALLERELEERDAPPQGGAGR